MDSKLFSSEFLTRSRSGVRVVDRENAALNQKRVNRLRCFWCAPVRGQLTEDGSPMAGAIAANCAAAVRDASALRNYCDLAGITVDLYVPHEHENAYGRDALTHVEDILRQCRAVISLCDVLLVVGANPSGGMKAEIAWARSIGCYVLDVTYIPLARVPGVLVDVARTHLNIDIKI